MVNFSNAMGTIFNNLTCFLVGLLLGVIGIGWYFRNEIFTCSHYDEHDPEPPVPKSKHRYL